METLSDKELLVRNKGLLLREPCVRPINLPMVDTATGEVQTFEAPCGSSFHRLCPSCAARKSRDNWLICTSGFQSVLGVEAPPTGEYFYFLTLTAPSFGKVHRKGSCPCGKKHQEFDEKLGLPLHFAKYDVEGQALWNSLAPRLLNRTWTLLRKEVKELHYWGSVEFQKRLAVHYHVLIRTSEPLDSSVVAGVLRRVHVWSGSGHTGERIVWGPQTDFQPIETSDSTALTYLHKSLGYSLKDFGRDLETPDLVDFSRFAAALTAAGDSIRTSGTVPGLNPRVRRSYAGGAGFTGHRVIKSRGWSALTHTSLALARRAYAQALRAAAAFAPSTWELVDRPYSTSPEVVALTRLFADQLFESIRVLSRRIAAATRGDPLPPLTLDHGYSTAST
ncbi:replication initiator [Luteococcus sp. Sow4_B9]|uniref:replication initiator n=1 Tax=Luteococcus sp. Sow4_B9 TaxID=3438792 RepID=UPI003F9E84A9